MKRTLTALFLAMLIAVPQANAGMIATQATERDRVMQLIERPEVAQQLEALGIPADQAKERVAAMTEAEVASLAGRLDSAIAGGALTNTDFLFIIVVILLVVVLL
jgi:hypothetical protein